MRRIKINTKDKYRVLLTDVLPYETPLFFSNEGFYRFCKNHLAVTPACLRLLITGFSTVKKDPELQDLYTVPYNYDIRKGTLDSRSLSLFHPAIQLQFVSLYERFSYVMLHLCTRSRFSLRYPASVASAIYGRSDGACDDAAQFGATYFHYEKYDLLYRFFESYEFQRLEKRFRHLRMFDISKCFNHIYTHTISWAVRSKAFAKKNLNSPSFDSYFDKIMQAGNHKETAGILIGPEVSRIFAEIILQRVDTVVEGRLADGQLKQGLDYDVRRYVDDYYVFSNTREIGEEVMRTYHQELKHYRLNFNDAKSIAMVVPFMTQISRAKIALSDLLSTFFDSLIIETPGGEGDKNLTIRLDRKANSLIQRIKAVVMSHNVEFASISGFLFSLIERRLNSTLISLSPSCMAGECLQRFLHAVLDTVFFIYAMDIRVSTTYKVGRIAIAACKAVTGHSPETEELIKKKIFDEARRILEAETRGHPELYVETVNLLAVIRVLGPEYRVAAETISKMIESMDRPISDAELNGVDYFLVIALLFHMADDSYYDRVRSELLERVLVLFKKAEDPSRRADFTCLFLDLLSCPFLDRVYKKQLTNAMKIERRNLSTGEKKDILNVVPSHQWFTDWLAKDSIDILLEKKRHMPSY